MTNWKEKEFEERYSNEVDKIYKTIYPVAKINRSTYSETLTKQLFCDKYLGIDTIIELTNGSVISAQEKLRNVKVLEKYPPSLCIELMNDDNKNEKGEWFYAIPQLYFVGYVSELTGNITEWYLIDTVTMKNMLSKYSKEELASMYLNKNVSPRKSSFLAIPIHDISESVIVYKNYTA